MPPSHKKNHIAGWVAPFKFKNPSWVHLQLGEIVGQCWVGLGLAKNIPFFFGCLGLGHQAPQPRSETSQESTIHLLDTFGVWQWQKDSSGTTSWPKTIGWKHENHGSSRFLCVFLHDLWSNTGIVKQRWVKSHVSRTLLSGENGSSELLSKLSEFTLFSWEPPPHPKK